MTFLKLFSENIVYYYSKKYHYIIISLFIETILHFLLYGIILFSNNLQDYDKVTKLLLFTKLILIIITACIHCACIIKNDKFKYIINVSAILFIIQLMMSSFLFYSNDTNNDYFITYIVIIGLSEIIYNMLYIINYIISLVITHKQYKVTSNISLSLQNELEDVRQVV